VFIATVPYSRLTRLRNSLSAGLKWTLSFRKRGWDLSDYPICIAKLELQSPFRSSRFEEHDYRASIINWSVMGSGNSPKEALESLRTNFETLKQNAEQKGTGLIRPGSHGKIEFASDEKTSLYGVLSEDFTHRVLELEWAWISDESSLWDFHTERTNDALNAKIREVYGVDVSDIESGRLWMIFERIEQSQHAT
jgi:hypothetical protein